MRVIQTGELNFERKRFWLSMAIPSILLFILWLFAFLQNQFGVNMNQYGIVPLNLKGLIGVLASPFLHADYKHLWSNTIPLWVLLTALFYYYPKVAWQTLCIIWIGEGLFVWLFARSGNHIGASGVVYGLASFHFVQGFLQRNTALLAFMFLEIFLFGGMVWGIFPEFFPEKNISWESHLFGLIIGVILALIYRHDGPPVVLQSWEMEPEEETSDDYLEKQENEDEDTNMEKTEPQTPVADINKEEKNNAIKFDVNYMYHKNREIKE